MYDASRFINAGFQHKDLFFVDGSTPSDSILKQFLSFCEAASGAVAVHCKGTADNLIVLFMIFFFRYKLIKILREQLY